MRAEINMLAGTGSLVCGGTMDGMRIALDARRRGEDVMLVTSGTTPAEELGEQLRPWMPENALDKLPSELRQALAPCVISSDSSMLIFSPVKAITAIEDLLLDAGVRLLYLARPVSSLQDGGELCGAVFGGKFGLAGIHAKTIFDCSRAGTLALLAGAKFANRRGGLTEASASFHVAKFAETKQGPITSARLEIRRIGNYAVVKYPLKGIGSPDGYSRGFETLHEAAHKIEGLGFGIFMTPEAYMHTPARYVTGVLPANLVVAVPHLERAFRQASGYASDKIELLLCLCGSRAASDALLKRLDDACGDFKYPMQPEAETGIFKLMPDHGWAPSPAHWINALAFIREKRLVSRIANLAGILDLSKPVSDGRFCIVHAFACAFERIATKDCVPIIRQLLGQPAFAHCAPPVSSDPRTLCDMHKERFSYLRLCLARALARCGDPQGYELLGEISREPRLFLARSAAAELAKLTSSDGDPFETPWREWLRKHPAPRTSPAPDTYPAN